MNRPPIIGSPRFFRNPVVNPQGKVQVMKKLRNIALFVFVVAGVMLVSIGKADAYIPREPAPDLHRICYLGHIGQPSGCVWVHV